MRVPKISFECDNAETIQTLTRREFNLFAVAVTITTGGFWPGVVNAAPTKKIIKPAALKRGDLVGLIAPSGATNAEAVERCVKNLEAFGMRVKVGKNILAARGNTAGTVAERIADLHAMFLDRDVKAIWAARGGSGCSQLLPFIDYKMIRQHPKILIGYSDITALHLALFRRVGLVSFHGPVASSSFSDYAATQLEAVLMYPRRETTIYMSVKNQAQATDEFKMRAFHHGVAEGRLIGGNLAVLAALVGTPYAADWQDALLFLEEIREAPYRIDRMLTQLKQSQSFERAAGIMLGVFRRSNAPDGDPSLSLEQTLDDHFAKLTKPAVYGFSFGHIPQQFTIPVGIRARLDTRAETLTLLETAVV